MKYVELLSRTKSLPYRIPTEHNRLARLADRRHEVEEHARGVRPILHGRLVVLMREFLEHKRVHGSPVERALYEGMDCVAFVTRLLTCRPLAFLTGADSYLLKTGESRAGGFEDIGTTREGKRLRLKDLLSYDEMAISAMVGVSVPTHFINVGGRTNRAMPGAPGSFEPRGIYVGLVGARFEREGLMEWQHMIVSRRQNHRERGRNRYFEGGAAIGGREYTTVSCEDDAEAEEALLRCWARFYGLDYFPTFEQVSANHGEFVHLSEDHCLNVRVYNERIRMVVEPFLLEANERAISCGKRAYVHCVGLGLGVWQVSPVQGELTVGVYAEILRRRRLEHISDIDFSWFGDCHHCGGVRDGEVFTHGGNRIRIHFSTRNPAERLVGPDEGKLLVAMYAWDSNAFPGNEYWLGSLSASGDPAAACCSNIPELQNPDVNPNVSGLHARVWTDDGGSSIGLPDFAEMLAVGARPDSGSASTGTA